jgi:hypothetical protein
MDSSVATVSKLRAGRMANHWFDPQQEQDVDTVFVFSLLQ